MQINSNGTHLYVLTGGEKILVDNYRLVQEGRKQLIEKRKNCQHDWKYDGHSHNDESRNRKDSASFDCYVCTICGKTEYR